jgi:hypothetical protein
MEYQEAMEATVTKATAIRELQKHGMQSEDLQMFFSEIGDKPSYTGSEVLNWLGY